jgi:predicted nucleic acid-binding protein
MPDALLDSNVLVAIVAQKHDHNEASVALFLSENRKRFAVAAHSFAEAYNSLTRLGGPVQFGLIPSQVWEALESIRSATDLLSLTGGQTLDAVKGCARSGGIGPRLYDRLIGEVAVVHGIPAIVTWNVGHLRSLFPALRVETPAEWMNSRKSKDQ